MNRIIAGAAITALLLGSVSAFAAATPAPAATSAPAVDYAARCTSLAGQWTTAEGANASNKSLGKAKSLAAKAAKQCASKKDADWKKGSKNYEAALKLLGVTPA